MVSVNLYSGSYLMVEVPEGTEKMTLRCNNDCDNGSISFYDIWRQKETILLIPNGQWKLLGLAKNLSEEQWEKIVNSDVYVYPDEVGNDWQLFFKDYTDVTQVVPSEYNLPDATTSGHSLLKSHNLKPSQTLILKQIN